MSTIRPWYRARAGLAALATSLAGCAAESTPIRTPAPALPMIVTPPSWPTLAACRAALQQTAERVDQACVRLDVENMLSPAFILRGLQIKLDATTVFQRFEAPRGRGELDTVRAFTVYLGLAPRGEHVIRLMSDLLPDPAVIPALSRYLWELKSSHTFHAPPGGISSIRIILYEKRDGRPIEESPAARYIEELAL